MNNQTYKNYTATCKNLLRLLQEHREIKLTRDKEWHRRLKQYRLQHGDYYAKDPRTAEPIRNRAGNKVMLRVPEFKKAQQLYNWLVNNLEQIINGNFRNVGKTVRRKFISEFDRNIDITLVDRQVQAGLDDLRIKITVMKDQLKEYKDYMTVVNPFLFQLEGKRVATDQYGNIIPVNVEPMSFDWLDDTRMVLENVNELFVTLSENPMVTEFSAKDIIEEALGE